MTTKTKTKSKAEEPKASKPQPKTFPPHIGRKYKTKLVVERTIRCNGHLHKIGLNSKGQLYIPEHKKEELERYIMMGDLGNNPCKCAVVYDAWRRGEFRHSQLNEEFQREKAVQDRLAGRLEKHRNKQRNWPDCDIIFGTLHPPVETDYSKNVYGSNALHRMAEFITETVYKTLLHRGWSEDLMRWEVGHTSIEAASPGNSNGYKPQWGVIFQAHAGGHGCISPYVGGELIANCAFKEDTKLEEIPWRTLIDGAEAKLMYHRVVNKQQTQLAERQEEFENLADERSSRFGYMPKHMTITTQKDKGTVTLKIEHPGLTIHTANRLVKHYRDTEDKVLRLLKHNRKRRALWYRTPATPSSGLGALKRNREKPEPVAVRSVEGEPDAD